MQIEVNEVRVDTERSMAIAAIISSSFLKEIDKIYNRKLIKSKYVGVLFDWCMRYYKQYNDAPDRMIEEIFVKEQSTLEDALVDNIRVFLSSISTEYGRKKKFNYKYVLDITEQYLRARDIEEKNKTIQALLQVDMVEEAERVIATHTPLTLHDDSSFDLFDDIERQSNLFKEENGGVVLFKFPEPLTSYFPKAKRGELGAFYAPAKRGKSFVAGLISRLGVLSGCNVGEFNFEMTEYQQGERHAMALSGRPGKVEDEGCRIPYIDCVKNIHGGCHLPRRAGRTNLANSIGQIDINRVPIGYKPCRMCDNERYKEEYQPGVAYRKSNTKALTTEDAKKVLKRVRNRLSGGSIKIQRWPSMSRTLRDIRNQLDKWESTGFIVDMIVIDYTELMNAENMKQELRHRITDNWAGMKRLAQERNIFVLALSQTGAATFEKKIRRGDTKESKSKDDHVDWAIALNQTELEEAQGVLSWDILFNRFGKRNSHLMFKVLTQFAISQAFVDAFIIPNTDL